MKEILLFVLAQSINESSLEYKDYHHNVLRLNFEDEFSNNEDMRNSTMFSEATNKVYLIWTNMEKNMSRSKPFDTKKQEK